MTQEKALTVQDRAVAALGLANLHSDLKELASKTKDLVSISNQDAYQQVHASRMVLKNQRLDITTKGKAARDDANAFSKAVIAEEKRLVEIIQPEESRLQALQKEFDEREERERQAKIDAEVARVEKIQEHISDLQHFIDHVERPGTTAQHIEVCIADLEELEINEKTFQEFLRQAVDAKEAALSRMRQLRDHAKEREAEAIRVADEREELAKLRAAEDARQAEAKAKQAAEEKAAREKHEAEAKKERQALEAQRQEQAEAQAKIDAENNRQAEERAAFERQQREAAEKAEAEAEAKRKAEAAAQAAAKKAKFPGEQAIVDVLVKHFGVTAEVARNWLSEIREAA